MKGTTNSSKQPPSHSNGCFQEEPLAERETREINCLRFVVAVLLVSLATAASVLVFDYASSVEENDFKTAYQVNAQSIIDSFHDAVERKLGAINSLSTAITSYALASNSSFPFVTVPDFELRGCDTRVQADGYILSYMPVVTDDDREDWEEYASRERGHIYRAYEEDEKRRTAQDKQYGLLAEDSTAGGGARLLQEIPASSARDRDSSLLAKKKKHIRQLRSHQQGAEDQLDSTLNTEQPPVVRKLQQNGPTVLNDGSGFHPKIWSNGALTAAGDEPEGTGPYLPIWQRSPIGPGMQKLLNLNFAHLKFFKKDGFPDILATKEAVLYPAAIPIPSSQGIARQNLATGQYRHDIEAVLDEPVTFLTYPVFKSFDDNKEVGGMLATNVYWKLLFSRILPESAVGYICVIQNSHGQTLTYRIDGKSATYLGEGDQHDERYDEFEKFADINAYVQSQANPRSRSYTTVPLNKQFGQYQLKIYPTADTEDSFITNRPIIYTTVILSIFVVTTIVLLCLDRAVARRQRIVMERLVVAAQDKAAAEREMNEYLAHEVRNPIAAALSAHGLVVSTLNSISKTSIETNQDTASCARDTLLEDMHIIGSSLLFVDDFLRSILDLYRANANRLQIKLSPVDLLKDILEPVCSILHQRGTGVNVFVDCPENLIIRTDALRLKQVMMNLGRNSIKFTHNGFVRFYATVVDGLVEIHVCDSGSGIPASKRGGALFEKFQASLDQLSQGTGVGLALCKNLVDLLGGEIDLDDSYDSGLQGFPGTKFVIKLKVPPAPELMESCTKPDSSSELLTSRSSNEGSLPRLPGDISALFVDDDSMLRKLFGRSIQKVAPSWKITEAASGESALRLVEDGGKFDVVFMDQYMASTEKQLLGSQTTRCMRERGVTSTICGLSANDLESVFLEAGADCFQLKPFPCKKDEMEERLVAILASGEQRGIRKPQDNNLCREDEKV